MTQETIPAAERVIVRDLAKRLAEIAALPVMHERVVLWKRHNALEPGRPLILVFPEGSWRELLPESAFRCKSKLGHHVEWCMLNQIYTHEHFDTDAVIETDFVVGKVLTGTGWGIQPQWHYSDEATGAKGFSPVIHEAADLKKIKFPTWTYDEKATTAEMAFYQELLGDILSVRLKGPSHVSFHLLNEYTALRGLEQVMVDMIECPEMLHEAMAILEDGRRREVQQWERLNVLSLNNDGTYHSSGGVGYIDELPAPGFDPGHVRPCDMWASAESQEMAQVSPEMHAEFALPYEKRLLQPFGLTGYGCCEDLTRKLDDVLTIPHIRRISISPWANVDTCAEKLGGRAIFSWKPHPAQLAGTFRPEAIRENIRHTLEVAKANGCVLEMILKDTHTCDAHPERFDQWTKIAREEVGKAWD